MKTDQDIDESLVKAYVAGNKNALAKLVKRWHKRFCDKAYWMVKDKDASKDIAQDSWTVIINKIDSLKDRRQFKFWAYRIIINKSTDWLRIQTKNRLNKGDYSAYISVNDETFTDISQLKKNLLKAIQTLPDGQKAVIKLFYLESYSIKQISELLNISAVTTKSRLFRARKKIKTNFKTKTMKTNMEDIDKLIKETLTQEEAKFYEELDEQNVFEMIFGLFKGKNKWIMYLMNVMTLVFFGLFVYCTIQFFNTQIIHEMIKWGIGGIVFLLGVSMLKVFAWMQMDKNALLREMKRLELIVSSLSAKISG